MLAIEVFEPTRQSFIAKLPALTELKSFETHLDWLRQRASRPFSVILLLVSIHLVATIVVVAQQDIVRLQQLLTSCGSLLFERLAD